MLIVCKANEKMVALWSRLVLREFFAISAVFFAETLSVCRLFRRWDMSSSVGFSLDDTLASIHSGVIVAAHGECSLDGSDGVGKICNHDVKYLIFFVSKSSVF